MEYAYGYSKMIDFTTNRKSNHGNCSNSHHAFIPLKAVKHIKYDFGRKA